MIKILKQKPIQQLMLLVSMNMISDKIRKKDIRGKSVKSLAHNPSALPTYFR